MLPPNLAVMAGPRPGHPRLSCLSTAEEEKTWMPGSSLGMTSVAGYARLFNARPSHPHFDQPRSVLGNGFRQRRDELVGSRHRAARNAHAPGERDKVERRAVDLQHVERALSRLAGADAIEFAAQDLIDAIGEHDGGDVEAFSRLRPQRLQRV